jgi:protein involved in polysaccharide export with SLBB domain
MYKRLVLLFPVLLLAVTPLSYSQDVTGNPNSSTQSPDCSDPDNAMLPACNAQNGNQTNTYGQQQNPNGSQVQPGQQQNPGMTQNPYQPGNAPFQNGQTYNDNANGINRNPQQQQQLLQDQYFQIPFPREPLTEFQRYTGASTGQILPIFGENLFRNVPSTFAPLDQAPVTADYVIGPGDELRIRIWGQVNFNANVKVDRAGDVYLPQVGPVHVAGLPFSLVDQHLRTDVARLYRNFDLSADLGQLRSIQIFVTGQARQPGTYTVGSLSTLANALFASGGPSVHGSMRHILLKRAGNTVSDFDLYDLLANGDTSRDVHLLSGDVIYIPPAGPQVALTGSVRRPAIYELRDATTIDQILKIAGGATAVASGSRISIERIQDHSARQAMEVALDSAGIATLLQDGDVLRVFSIVPRYQKTVTLRGNTANPGRFAWHEGMHLSELIPDRESLVTRNYWWRNTQLGLPAPEFEPLIFPPNQYQPNFPVDLQRRNFPMNGQQQGQFNSQINSQFNPQLNSQQQYQYPLQQGQQLGNQGASQLPLYFDPNNPQGSLQTQGQQPTQNNRPDASTQTSGSSLGGQVNQVITQNTASATSRTDVRLSAPEIDWAYAVIERMDPGTLKTSLVPFDLGKLVLNHDASQDLALQPGDVVSVFSQADIHVPLAQQTKFVRLEGEFVSSGIYSVLPGETLRQLVQRVGGLTPGSYLYGSEFTRESTRVVQQQRIDEYVQSLELSIQRGALAQASTAVSATDISSAAATSTAQKDLLTRLHQLRATGRIVLELKPESNSLDSIPDLDLQDGDQFVVPSKPATVNVVGAVYDQNTFVFGNERRVSDYLRLAGGPNRDADRKHAFIIRADGSVFSWPSANGLWGNAFLATKINPGDTLIVPEKTLRPSALRGLLDWSQVFSQLALGVAAVRVL